MRVGILKETIQFESRVSATPETVKKMTTMGLEVLVQTGAGESSSFSDELYAESGAKIVIDEHTLVQQSDVICAVQCPHNLKDIRGKTLIAIMSPYHNSSILRQYSATGLRLLAMEMMPRITRAQNMDVLSSQSNLAGYRAVIEAANFYTKAFPMMMTAAGTIAPAGVLVLGAGVAGLQAIATAKRLGAVVSAFDVRKAAGEQVKSLGAKFIEVDGFEDAETVGGYAKSMSEEYKIRQSNLIHEAMKKADIVISTALIPGKPAPILIYEEMVHDMKPGSVIVDLAASNGGNCVLTKPDEVNIVNGVTILGYTNMASRIAKDASALYAKNILNFMQYIVDIENNQLKLSPEDEIIKAVTLAEEGQIIHEALRSA